MKLNNRQRAKLTLDELEKEMEILTKEEMNACKGGEMFSGYTGGIVQIGSGIIIGDVIIPYDYGGSNSTGNGWLGGSGTENAPYLLSEVVVTANRGGGGGDSREGGSSNFGGSVYYTGGGSSFSSYGSVYGPNPNMGGGGSNSSHYTNDKDNNSFDLSQIVSDLWNSTVARVLVPDVLSLNLSTSATAILGVNFEFSVNFITRGNDASPIPVITFSPGGQVGPGVFADASVGVSRGYFRVTDVRQLDPGRAKERIGGWTVEGVIGVGTGAGGSLNASIGLDERGNPVFFEIGASGGAAIGSGWFVGQSHTLIVNP